MGEKVVLIGDRQTDLRGQFDFVVTNMNIRLAG
jgi:hypothetical protein